MRKEISLEIEQARVLHGRYATPPGSGMDGAYVFKKARGHSGALVVIVSAGVDWEVSGLPPPTFEHVSVSRKDKCPTWDDMCFVKNIFWHEDEIVIQYHPRRSDYVNYHENCLHLWKPVGVELPAPPPITIGPIGAGRPK